MILVKKKVIAKNKNEENADSIRLLKKYPTRAAGIVAIIKYFQRILDSFSNLKSRAISFLVKIITATKEAK